MFRYAACSTGAFREHYQFGAEVDRLRRPGGRRRADRPPAALVRARRRARAAAAAELDRRRQVPAGVPRAAGRLPRRARDELCDECRERRDTNPLRVLDCKNARAASAVMAPAPEDHRPPVRRVRGPLRRRPRHLDARGVAVRRRPRRSCAASTTTRAPPGSCSGRRAGRADARSAAAAATTAWPSSSAGRRRRASASDAGVERAGSRRRAEPPAADRGSTAVRGARRRGPPAGARGDGRRRAAGVRCDAALRRPPPASAHSSWPTGAASDGRHRRRGRVGGRRGDAARYDYR